MPGRYGPWWRVYALFACWQVPGVREHLEQALIVAADAAGKVGWDISVDSTTARAHVHAAGARRDSSDRIAEEPDDHALGRSRGGWSTKLHLACERDRQVLAFMLTAGQAGDSPHIIPVLQRIRVPRPGPGRPRTRADRVLGDKAYSSRANRAYLARRGIKGQGTLFEQWRHHAFFTTTPRQVADTVAVDKIHRGHAIIEQVHADLKGSALAPLPSGKFTANAAWLVLAVIAFNLTRATGVLGGRHLARATTGTIRRKLINVPARAATSARRLTLHLPKEWPWEHAWIALFTCVADPPQRAAA